MKIDEFLPPDTLRAMQLVGPGGGMLTKQLTRGPMRAVQMGVENVPSDWIKNNIGQRRYLLINLYMLSYMTSEVRAAITTIRNEVFRRGLMGWVPKFEKKCTNPECGDEGSTGDECRLCGSELRGPDLTQYKYADQLFKRCNKYGQTFEEVLKQAHDDLNIADDAFILMNKEYRQVGEHWEARTVELYRLHPALVEFDLSEGGDIKMTHFTCRVHRNFASVPGNCSICGMPLEPVFFIYTQNKKKTPLLDDEIVHYQKFSPSILYGLSPLLTLFEKTLTMLGMDKFLYRYFFERKMPSSIIVTTTDDTEGLRREREYLEMKLREDPDYTPWLGVSARTGRGRTDIVRLYHTLQEMDYLPVRAEIRERIASFYGVTPVWENVGSGGGLNRQSQELIVTSRVVESDQRIYHTKVFPELLSEGFGITDWKLVLNQPEEKAECFSKDILVLTEEGLLYPEEVKTEGRVHFGKKYFACKTIDVETSIGSRVRCTLNHPFWTRRGWVNAGDLTPTDEVLVPVGYLSEGESYLPKDSYGYGKWNQMSAKRISVPKKLTPKLARLIGYWVAEGGIHEKTVGIATSDEAVVDDVRDICGDFGLPSIPYYKGCDLRLMSTPFAKWFGEIVEWRGNGAQNKKVPLVVRKAGKECVLSFLSGYLQDAWIDVVHNKIEYCTVSERLAREVQQLLLGVGVLATLRYMKHRKRVSLGDRGFCWSVQVSGRYAATLAGELLKYDKSEKGARLKVLEQYRPSRTIWRNQYLRPTDSGFWVVVRGVSNGKVDDVFDIEDSLTHEIVIAGVLTHNSTRIQFAQQRTSTATVLKEMGFEVRIIGEKSNLDSVEFIVSNPKEEEEEEEENPAYSPQGEPDKDAIRGKMPSHEGDMHRHATRNYPHLRSEPHSNVPKTKEESGVTSPIEGVDTNVYPGERPT
jgi:intein/homing endonuclease